MVRDWDRTLVPTDAGRTDAPDPACPVEAALRVVGGRWTTLVIRELLHGPLSYRDLGRLLPSLSDKVLSERLARLTDLGVAERMEAVGFPTRVTYRLTARGEALRPLMTELYRTGTELLAPEAN
ncbi:winged helix-turn-helix transcriptional regulator [Glycomyces xiaoerkulensis]|uniref:winged helix-turn-helix transcriptional regulator n=1 Tax=Glycomyces xiaoerkulensis TaxID=2038139 RepID=UPI000C26577A|nr:helix-turn-helix domain-containing protein [Glycomyces xiaoerkulensis]